MERKIGEIFTHRGKKLQCVEEHLDICDRCYYFNRYGCNAKHIRGECSKNIRKDHKSIIFVELKEDVKMDKPKEITIFIPDGYEIDEDLSSFDKIIFKKKERQIKTWDDLISKKVPIGTVVISHSSSINEMVDYWRFDKNHDENLFINKKYAKSSLAMSQISQLLPYYGGAITEEEWEDENIFKYNIERYKNTVYLDGHSTMYTFLAFHTEEQRDSFYKNNKQLVNDYLMISNND